MPDRPSLSLELDANLFTTLTVLSGGNLVQVTETAERDHFRTLGTVTGFIEEVCSRGLTLCQTVGSLVADIQRRAEIEAP